MATTVAESGGSPFAGRRIRLAREPAFRIGPLAVDPSRRSVVHDDGREEIVEPRVMQVFAALFAARGTIVGRDELVDRCWDGRIVGEDSINRVLSRLRRLAESVGSGVFRIETVTKVGYRLVLEDGVTTQPPAPAEPADPALLAGGAPAEASHADKSKAWATRRTILSGFFAAATAAAAPAIWPTLERTNWFGLRGHVPNEEARRLYEEGMRVQYQGFGAPSDQAEAYFRQAAAADPEWADAWGSLAMSYRHMMDGETNVAQWRLVQQTRSAAARALELDPGNEEATVALALMRSPYRRWAETEAEYRPLVDRYPGAFVLHGHYARLLRNLGRFAEAVEVTREVARQHPFIVFTALGYLMSLWGAGRLQEAEAEAERIFRRWPRLPAAWMQRFEYLLHTGRPGAALALASDREGWPIDMPPFLFERRQLFARALETRVPTDISAAVEAQQTMIARFLSQPPSIVPAEAAVPFFAAIGDLDTSFALLEGYFFDRGRFAPRSPRQFGPLTRRETAFLFMPFSQPLWRDRRFRPLLEEIGLIDHYRRTGTRPDIWRRHA